MGFLVRGLAGVVSGAAILVAVLLANGGYVYRTQCPHLGGSTETDWSYRIYAIFPYIGYSRTGCEVHTATRIALDAIGLWKIHDVGTAPPTVAATDHRGEYSKAVTTSMQTHCVSTGKSASFCGCAMNELTRDFSPTELAQISSVTRFDQLPTGLAQRASVDTTAIDQDCH